MDLFRAPRLLTMRRPSPWIATALLLCFATAGLSIKIRPESCTDASGAQGTCMFVWQCIKADGVQLGPCVDRFLVGACCRLPHDDVRDNLVPGAHGNASKPQLPPAKPHATQRPDIVMTTRPLMMDHPSTTPRPVIIDPSTRPPSTARPFSTAAAPLAAQESAQSITKRPFSECGVPSPHPKSKVVGGTHASFGEWPWQVSVRRSSFFGFASTHRCGGAILSEEWVATAAHCVDDLLKSQIRIRVGEYDFSSISEPAPFQERGVERKLVHPRYNFFTYEHDLALLRLEAPLQLRPHVKPICLPREGEGTLVGVNATVTGWGRLSEGGTLPSKLQQVQVPIISNEKCARMFAAAGRQESIPDIFLCAGYEQGGRDSCQGDSGGPLQAKGPDGRWFLAGIISWGIGCAEPNMPGVCTRISKFADWIRQNIG